MWDKEERHGPLDDRLSCHVCAIVLTGYVRPKKGRQGRGGKSGGKEEMKRRGKNGSENEIDRVRRRESGGCVMRRRVPK